MTLKVYGNLISQPSRALAWLLKVKKVKYELIVTRPPGDMPANYAKINPNKLVPTIQDGDFTLFEGNAIMTYLADKHQWTDVYPTDLKTRAKVDQYLHWHHTNTRLGTKEVLIPYVRRALGNATPSQLEAIENKEQVISKFVNLLEIFLKGPNIANTNQPTLADYAAYCEVDQLEIMDVFDFSKYPKTSEWMLRMKEIPHHDDIRTELNTFLTKFNLNPVSKE